MFKQNVRWTRFSLKWLFVVMAVVPLFIYRLMPIRTEIYCDRITSSIPNQVDIMGRNESQKFETILTGVKVQSVERSDDPNQASLRIKIWTTIYNKQKLEQYDVLCIRDSD